MEVYGGIALRVDLMRASQLLRFIKLPFQSGNLSVVLLINGCHANLGSFPDDKDIPKYLSGNCTT
jgi:hypothetical protein